MLGLIRRKTKPIRQRNQRFRHANGWLFGKAINLARRKRVPTLTQMDATECGATCLAMILNYYGRKTTIAETRIHCGIGRDGSSAFSIVKAARNYGLRVRAISLQQNDFRYVALPAIVHWEFNHFIIVERWSLNFVDVVDPAYGRKRITVQDFDRGFTGVVIMLEPGVQFSRESEPAQLSLSTYLRYVLRLPGFIVQIVSISLLLQLLGLAMPLLTKVFVDNIIPNGMSNLMPIMGIGILILVLTQSVMTLLRSSLLVYLQAKVDIQMMLGFFEHLLTLPYRFFQQRSTGDLLTRVNSNIAIRDMLTNQMISSILDGGTVIVYLFILLGLSHSIAFYALALGLMQVGLLLLTNRRIHELTKQDLTAQGKAQGYMAEALTGIATLKSVGAEPRALQHWSNLFFDHLNVSVKRDYLSAVLGTVMNGLSTLAPLLLLWLGTRQVLDGSMSLGTMLALNSLAAAFLSPLTSLASSGQKLQLIRAHFERIADVIDAEPEQDIRSVKLSPTLRGSVELKHVNFRYDPHAKLVLHDINITIERGQKIALVGRTGSGKSTLGKLLLGLYIPTEGEILYDGHSLYSLNYRTVRNQFGVVLQEASFFNGSIRENITFNDSAMSMEQVIKSAQIAAIDDDITEMPMGYETMIAEGGSALSGGQRQRLALARAVASLPAILLLDEATSNLDVQTEQIVDQNLNSLACTRIVIAHRLSTVRNADLILVLENGAIVERGTHDALIHNEGYYAKLVRSQIEKKKIEVT